MKGANDAKTLQLTSQQMFGSGKPVCGYFYTTHVQRRSVEVDCFPKISIPSYNS